MGDTRRIVYCIDTSALITIQRTYRRSVFPGLWDSLDELVSEGRLASPREVLRELEQGSTDEIQLWAKGHESMFRNPDAEQLQITREVVNDPRFPGLFDIEREIPEADPFVIALAVAENRRGRMIPETWVVVADETPVGKGRKPRIPDVCRDDRYRAECVTSLDMFESERWQFGRIAPP